MCVQVCVCSFLTACRASLPMVLSFSRKKEFFFLFSNCFFFASPTCQGELEIVEIENFFTLGEGGFFWCTAEKPGKGKQLWNWSNRLIVKIDSDGEEKNEWMGKVEEVQAGSEEEGSETGKRGRGKRGRGGLEVC